VVSVCVVPVVNPLVLNYTALLFEVGATQVCVLCELCAGCSLASTLFVRYNDACNLSLCVQVTIEYGTCACVISARQVAL
jgi:hypothetical protein